ncbi:MAG TPA: hypothetical protein VIK95_07895 [Egibacteraceae bacterium]
MSAVHIVPDTVPEQALAAPGVRVALVRLEGRLAAMGLLDRVPGALDEAALAWADPAARAAQLLAATRAAGIGGRVTAALQGSDDPQRWQAGLAALLALVEQSPHPSGEWRVLSEVLGADLLQRLVGVARSSLARYRSGTRETPAAVAARLHHIAMVVADLEGGYNTYGIRRWFERRRAQLDGRRPVDLLEGDWDPDDDGPRRVAELAAALDASPAT